MKYKASVFNLMDGSSLQRQVFFRKKLQQASHSLRAMSLGQDRYRRRYWLMPQIGAIMVEGPEELLGRSNTQSYLLVNCNTQIHCWVSYMLPTSFE